jgi:hypothetical protein
MGTLLDPFLWRTGRPLGTCVQRPHSWGRVLAGGKRVYASGGRSLGGMSFAMEKSRLSSDSSDNPFIFSESISRGCHWFDSSRPGRGAPLKGGCSQDWLPHKGSIAAIATPVESRGRPIANRPQVANLPHKGLLANVNAARTCPEAQTATTGEIR